MAGRDVDRLQEEIAELFADLWRVPRFVNQRGGFRPNVDSYHTDDPHQLTVVVELPGVDPASVSLVVGERALVISGDRPRPKVGGGVYQQLEIDYGPFQRRIELGEEVDPVKAAASYEHGMLKVTLPLASSAPAEGGVPINVRRP